MCGNIVEVLHGGDGRPGLLRRSR
ncbi:MAG: hypothetical protein MZV70_69760 [Desulfobacterales bacterium]|nr:hypothetical protein [Desulfobacterales bacterium]